MPLNTDKTSTDSTPSNLECLPAASSSIVQALDGHGSFPTVWMRDVNTYADPEAAQLPQINISNNECQSVSRSVNGITANKKNPGTTTHKNTTSTTTLPMK